MDELAGGDVSKYEYFENMHIIKFLNMLTYKIEKAEEEKVEVIDDVGSVETPKEQIPTCSEQATNHPRHYTKSVRNHSSHPVNQPSRHHPTHPPDTSKTSNSSPIS